MWLYVTLGPYLTVLMQKLPAPASVRYQYLVTESLLMSSAKKDTETHQREGYTLLDETELGGISHFALRKSGRRREKVSGVVGFQSPFQHHENRSCCNQASTLIEN